LRRIAKETGGAFFFPERVGDLVKVFAEIANELHSHYALGYTPKRAADGTWREIELRLARKDLKDVEVRVRKGYFAVKRRRPPRPAGEP
jgi:VWFA-related protein